MQRQPPNFAVERHSMTTPTELGPAGKLIAKGWTQGEMARNAKGDGVEPESKEAVCFCVVGALHATYENSNDLDVAFEKLHEVINTYDYSGWNDNPYRTKEQVEEAMMKAGV